jgi:hypothetical protein
MADISYNIQANVSKGLLSQSFAASGVTANMSATGLVSLTLNLGTAVTQISTASLSEVGLCVIRSLATTTTHTVSFGRYSGSTLYESMTLRAGEAAVLRLAPGSYAAKSAVEGSKMLLHIIEG